MSVHAELIRVRGLVQGVGFRPAVYRLAQRHALSGSVANDGEGVRIHVGGSSAAVEQFVASLRAEAPPLARIDGIEREPASQPAAPGFAIVESATGPVATGIVPDAALCPECRREVLDPFSRRFRYPFTNCTHCGPRLSIVEAIPYDRAATTMRAFELCAACRAEYEDPGDRRFHAQPIACHACGPRAELRRADRAPIALDAFSMLDAVDAACTVLQRGHLLAIKGLGGWQLACDALNENAVARLRARKQREGKPFALMARDLDVVRAHARVDAIEAALLQGAAAPIVVLDARGATGIASAVAPGLRTLGFMLPATPLHELMLRRMKRPIVLTSGNRSDEPQCIDDAEVQERLGDIAEYFLGHDRRIARRVDDSVVRMMDGAPRVLRRARGHAPAPLLLPRGFERAPPVLALGGELKNTFCLLQRGTAVLSHHIGDLENAPTFADYEKALADYRALFEHKAGIVAVDRHPDYLSTKLGRELAARETLPLAEVQHHHAHIAACMAENGIALDAGPVLGVALDGLGYGEDGALWGGEFLRADYRSFTRLGTFKQVAMPGGEQAIHEPWRNAYAHLMAEMKWPRFEMNFAELELFAFLRAQPRALLDGMIAGGVNSPLASSCGRLFDAAAAMAGVRRERAQYEGQAAIEFEARCDERALREEPESLAYPFAIPRLKGSNLPYLEPLAVWDALLGDLILKTPVGVISARFHRGLALAIARMVDKVGGASDAGPLRTVCLSGGVFQNQVLLELVSARLRGMGYAVLSHAQVPANDGGLSLGQGVIAAARAMKE